MRLRRLSRQRSTNPELFTRRRWKPDKHSTYQETLSTQRSTYPELFIRRRWKPDKHSTNQGTLSSQRSTYPELFTRLRWKLDKHSTYQGVILQRMKEHDHSKLWMRATPKKRLLEKKNLITWTTHLKNKQGKDIHAKKTSTKNKESSFKKEYNILL